MPKRKNKPDNSFKSLLNNLNQQVDELVNSADIVQKKSRRDPEQLDDPIEPDEPANQDDEDNQDASSVSSGRSMSGEYSLRDYERIRDRKIQKWTQKSSDKNLISASQELYAKLFPRIEAISVLRMNIPENEKKNLLLAVDELLCTCPGTREYHNQAMAILQKIDQYSNDPRILPIVRRITEIMPLPTLKAITESKANDKEKKEMMFMLEDLYEMTPGSPAYDELSNKLHEMISIANAKDPALDLIKVEPPVNLINHIWESDISLHNKKVLIEKAQTLSHLGNEEAGKLRQYIMDGIKLSDCIMPIPNADSHEQFLRSARILMDKELYGQDTVKNHMLELIALRLRNATAKEASLGLCGPPGTGKCLHPDTLVLLYLGGMKRAADLKRNDVLMGDDSQPRVITSTSSGKDSMYCIQPKYTENFIVNLPHVLTLYDDLSAKTIDIPLEQYMMRTENFKKRFKLFTVPVEYDERPVKNDPYMIGVLLGSNKKNVNEVIKQYLDQRLNNVESYIAGKMDCQTIRADTFDTEELAFIMNQRYIPEVYLYNTRKIRHKLLKGFIASHRSRRETRHSIESLNDSLGIQQPRSKSIERFRARPQPLARIHRVVVPHDTIRKTKRSVTPAAFPRSSLKEFMEEKYGAGNISYSPISRDEPELETILSAENSYRTKHKGNSSVGRIMKAVESARMSLVEHSQHEAPSLSVKDKSSPEQTMIKHRTPKTRSARLSLQEIISGLTAEDLDDFEELEAKLQKPSSAPIQTKPKETRSRLAQFKTKIPKLPSTTIKISDRILGEQLKFLARSLGFRAVYAEGELVIADDINKLPMMDKKITTDFSVSAVGHGNYCGITITGNGRFVLATGIVTHNTEIAKVFANAMQQPFSKINMGGVRDSSFLLGHSFTYVGSKYGAIARALMTLKSKSGVIFLDEFDKIRADSHVSHLLLHVTDPVQQAEFVDHYFEELKLDISNITFIFSMNSTRHMNSILLNRIPIIEMKPYTQHDYKMIMTKFVLPKLLVNLTLNEYDIKLSEEVQNELAYVAFYNNQGVRPIKHTLQRIVLKLNLLHMLKDANVPSFPIVVTSALLQKIKIDIPKPQHNPLVV